MLRDVTIRQTMHEMVGDETVEVWLKIGAGDWELDRVDDVGAGPTQDFEFIGVEEGVAHVMQTRAVREGRYRAGYLGADPDGWPEQSRVEFIPGTAEAAAPTIVSTDWDNPTTTATVTVTPNPAHLDLDLQLLRDGVVVDTIAAPHVGDVVFETVMASDDDFHDFTSRHVVSGGLVGTQSAPETLWTGGIQLFVDSVDVDSIEDNLKAYFNANGEGWTTLRLFWRWPIGSYDYPGPNESDRGVVTLMDSPHEVEPFDLGYSSFTEPGADLAHDIEFQLRAYDGIGTLLASSTWSAGQFFTPSP